MQQSKSPVNPAAITVAVVLAALWSVLTRFGDLSADPALNLSASAGVLYDPFSHSGNARSYVLFGDLHPDQWNSYIYSPLYVLLQVLWFQLCGISVASMQAYGATWSALALLLCWLTFRRLGAITGALALTFLGSQYLFSQLGRLALLENCAIFFTSCALLCLAQTLTARRAFLCGFFAFLIFVVKGIIFYAVPAIGAGVLLSTVQTYLEEKNWKRSLTIFGWYLFGTVCAFLPWLFLFRVPNDAEIAWLGPVWWRSVSPGSWEKAFNFLIDDKLFTRICPHDLASVVLLITIGFTLYRLLTDWRKITPVAVALLFYFIFGALFVGLLRYKPTRFCAPLILPMLGLCAIGLAEFWKSGTLKGSFKRCWAADICGVFTLTLVFRMQLYLWKTVRQGIQLFEFGILPGQWDSLLASGVLAIFCWGFVRVLLAHTISKPIQIPVSVRRGAVVVFVIHFLYANIGETVRWWNQREHSIRDASRQLRDEPHMVIGGLSVHALVMETGHRAVRIEQGGWHNSGVGNRIFVDLGLTHFLLTDYNNLRAEYFQRFPQEMRQLEKVAVFNMCKHRYDLYRIPENIELTPPRAPKPGKQKGGKRRRKTGEWILLQ